MTGLLIIEVRVPALFEVKSLILPESRVYGIP